MERMEAVDIAETIALVVTRPRRVAINEVFIRPANSEVRCWRAVDGSPVRGQIAVHLLW